MEIANIITLLVICVTCTLIGVLIGGHIACAASTRRLPIELPKLPNVLKSKETVDPKAIVDKRFR